jgi:hypothetical protein
MPPPTELTAPISEDLANNDKQIALTVTTHAPGQPIPVIQPVVLEIPSPGPIPVPIPLPLLQGAVCGACDMGIGVHGSSQDGLGVYGSSGSKQGVYGVSTSNSGVYGNSAQFDAVVGETQSDAHAGVTGRNLTTGQNGGVGIYGTGGQFAGKFDGNVQINGVLDVTSNSPAHSITGALRVGGDVNANDLVARQNAVVAGTLFVEGTGSHSIAGTLNVGVDVAVGGTVHVKGDVVLANQDCAEDFDIGPCTNVEPGTVMVLDERGFLQESRHTYDKKVAGVISGAGEFKPGLILGRVKGQSECYRAPVALLGKVYCKVDTQHAPIEVGDLLTTSATPGHAMKAEDPIRAFGAAIGKALRSVPAGQKGLIPILVTLQ